LDVTTGQRKYGGPPPGWDGPTPGNGCEVSGSFIVYSCKYLLNVAFVTCQFHNSTLNIAPQWSLHSAGQLLHCMWSPNLVEFIVLSCCST